MSDTQNKKAEIQEAVGKLSEEFAKDMSMLLAGYRGQSAEICAQLRDLGLPWDHADFVIRANMQKAGIYMLAQLFNGDEEEAHRDAVRHSVAEHEKRHGKG